MKSESILDNVIKRVEELENEKNFYFEQLKELFKVDEHLKNKDNVRASRLVETNKLYTISQYIEALEEEEELIEAFYNHVEQRLNVLYDAEEAEKKVKNNSMIFDENENKKRSI